ncbi:MAG: M23 family metallopeptidase [Psychrilyobacter sp.]|nr:M23 family metallopeptidase [Psychrilyobacter sp.]
MNKKILVGLLTVLIVLNMFFAYNTIKKMEEEVVNTEEFTEFYTEREEEGGGVKLLESNFKVYEKHYKIVTEKVKEESKKRPEITTYVVKSGDTLGGIANKFGQTQTVIKYNNSHLGKYLKIGQKITITRGNSITYKVAKGDTLGNIAHKFGKSVSSIQESNHLKTTVVHINQKLVIESPKVDLNKISKKTTGIDIYWPVKWAGITSPYGRRFHPVLKRWIGHMGVDLRAHYIPVKASDKGIVTYSGWMNGYGNIVIIKHSYGYETRYGHLKTLKVKRGQRVRRGQLIAISGATGRVTGPHLHYEIRKNGTPINPMKFYK